MTENLPVPYKAHMPVLPSARPAFENPYRVYLRSLDSRESARTMTSCLGQVVKMIGFEGDPESFPWEQLRFQVVTGLRSKMTEQTSLKAGELVPWSTSTINKHLSAIRGVTKSAWELGLMTAEEYHRIKAVKGVKGSRLPAGRSIAAAELVAMLTTCVDGSIRGVRDAAMIAVLATTGGRRAEIAFARRENYDPGRRALRIVGKGNKEREVFLTEQAAAYLGLWLSKSDSKIGPMFSAIDKWGHVGKTHMTTRSIGDIVDNVRLAAGLPKLTTHDFRRTFIGNLLDLGVDLATTQSIVGHESPTTTAKYDRRPSAARKAAVDRLRIPSPDELLSVRP